MLEKKELEKLLGNAINEKLSVMERRLESLEQEFSNLKEDSKITRCAVNLVLDWAENASIQTVPLHQRETKDDTLS